MFEGVWSKLDAKSYLERQLWTKYLRKTLVFIGNWTLRQNFNFCFASSFLLVSTKFLFWEEDWALGYSSVMC